MHQGNGQISKPEAPHNGSPNEGQPKPSVEKKGFKRAEAALYLGVAKITIDRLTKRGLLHPSRALRHPIYSRDDLDRFLRETSGEVGVTG
jgi:hypothetical protein